MKTYKYKARNGNIQFKPGLSWLLANTENSAGFCVGCGTEHDCVEPDARKYHCTNCNAHKVYGCEELILMGLYRNDPAAQVSP